MSVWTIGKVTWLSRDPCSAGVCVHAGVYVQPPVFVGVVVVVPSVVQVGASVWQC
jgi:hypothetical protein